MTTVDFYLRLSVDREGKDSLERQESDLRKWAKREGLTVRKVWRDAGKSGYKTGVVREDFDAAIRAVSSGEVDALAAWKLDRLSRRGAGQVGLVLDAVEEVGGRLVFLQDSLDTKVPGHRMVILMVSEQARTESANTSMRVSAKIASDAAQGLPKGGVRSFGWEADGTTLRDSEADLVRRAVKAYLKGNRSMLQIAKDWTAAGVLTDGMKRSKKGRDGVVRPARQVWTATTVRQVLLRERNAGVLIHQGERMPKSQIQPIITLAQLEEMKARVKVGTPVGARAQTLLGGVLRCECGAPMHGTVSYSSPKKGPRHTYPIYKCAQTLYDRSRRHASIQQKLADDLFTALIVTDLYKGDLTTPEVSDVQEGLQRITELLTANGEDMAHVGGILLDRELKSLHASARGDLKVLEVQRAELMAEHEALLAQAREDGGMNAFMEAWHREDVESFEHREDFVEWEKRFREAWNRIDIDKRQGLIRSRYRPVVKVGGRGVGRIVPNSVDPTLGKALEELPDPLDA